MDINKLLSDLQATTKEEAAELWELLKADGHHLVDVAKVDLGVGGAQTASGDPVPPDPTHPHG